MTCKDCTWFKEKNTDKGIDGYCTSLWNQDFDEPPYYLRSKKKKQEWLNSDERYMETKSTDENCTSYQTKDFSI